MAAQRRVASRGPEGGGTAAGPGRGGHRRGSAKKSKGQQESWWRWLKAALLLSSAAVGGLLSWSYLSAEDGVTEVLAHRRDSLQDKFVEVPCSEDYDSHKRFEEEFSELWTCGFGNSISYSFHHKEGRNFKEVPVKRNECVI